MSGVHNSEPRRDERFGPLDSGRTGRLSEVIRRLLTALTVAMALAACGSVPPSAPPSSVAVRSPASVAVSIVGTDGTALGQLVAELEAQALSAKGMPATTELAPSNLDDAVAKLSSGDLSVLPVFARTAATALDLGELPSGAPDLVQALAQSLAGEAAVMQPGKVTADPVFVVRSEDASEYGVSSLADLSTLKQPVPIAAPPGFGQAPEGSAGLSALYGVTAHFEAIADPTVRIEKLSTGAVVAVLRPTESRRDGLVTLTDPNQLIQPDPLVVLLAPSLANDQDVVLALKALDDKLTNPELAALLERAAEVGVGPAATEWLTANGLG